MMSTSQRVDMSSGKNDSFVLTRCMCRIAPYIVLTLLRDRIHCNADCLDELFVSLYKC